MESKPVRDDTGAQRTLRELADRRIPDDLVQRLHRANGRADELRRDLEETLGGGEFEQAARVDSVGADLRAAEQELEEVNRLIREAAPPQAKPGG